MNEQRDEKWLDELIAGNINTSEPKFGAEKWKQKYAGEYQTLVDRSSQRPSAGQVGVLSMVLKSRAVKVAAAAVIIVAIGFFIVHQRPSEQDDTTTVSKATKSPAEMQAILSLSIAYRRGGIQAVDRQCQKAIEMLGARPAEITIQQILTEFNGM